MDAEKDRFKHTLQEREVVIFDNRRVLHGRTEFYEEGDTMEEEPSRWLKGCYLEADDILALHRRLSMMRIETAASDS